MFKKGDYIVTLKVQQAYTGSTNCGRDNYCFKQRLNSNHIVPDRDLRGSATNANDALTFDKDRNLLDWRYAYDYEKEYYNQAGKPFDISIILTADYLIDNLNKLEDKIKLVNHEKL